MKLGSLFDGSGGFPLAGLIHGITPVWASEIEPYPLRVTKARLPDMKQLGDVIKINGAEIEPVDIITFGSPCQDLSVAGKQAGIFQGTRSNLFFEAIRIIQEMQNATANQFPRWAVWENVPGAFSSHKGEDFQAVLQALCQIRGGRNHIIPLPQKRKWKHAGCIVGNGFSIAWRQYDAQFWGVPQRRKRIYLIADFRGERAGEILFERESVCRDYSKSGTAQETASSNAQRGAGGSIGTVFPINTMVATRSNKDDGRTCFGIGQVNDPQFTISAAHEHAVCYTIQGNTIDRKTSQNGSGISEGIAPTITAADMHGVCFPTCFVPDGNHCGAFAESNKSATLQTKYHYGSGGDGALAVYDARGNGNGKTVPTLTGDHQNRVTDYTAICVNRQRSFGEYINDGTASALKARDYKDATNLVIERKPKRKYIVRRLTPLECCRLQGFPDWWEEGVEGKDSARYKMWGNGIALPCAADVLGRIAQEGEKK